VDQFLAAVADHLRAQDAAAERPTPVADRSDGIDVQEMERRLDEVFQALVDEIRVGLIDLDLEDGRLIIRIRERGSFPSGSADLEPLFVPVVERIGAILERLNGEIAVTGHTDSVPLRSRRYRSNWELSAARAVSVAHELLAASAIAPGRVVVMGRSDTQPLADNESAAGRARNRRVEIAIDMYPGKTG
jgi:chemotaxis protein MotB